MGKSFEFKECERFLKRVLKDKGMYSKGAVIAFLITGGIGFVAPVLVGDIAQAKEGYQGYIVTDPRTGITGTEGIANDDYNKKYNSVILGPTRSNEPKGALNKEADGSVIIGVEAVGHGTTYGNEQKFTAVGYNAHVYGGQGTAFGSNTLAASQATAIGNDVYASGASSIAIGNDDISSKYRDALPIDTLNKLYGNGDASDDKKKLFKNIEWVSTNNSRKSTDPLLNWTNFKNGYHQTDTKERVYSPTISAGIGSIAMGSRSVAYKDGSTAIGTLAFALGEGSTAMGLRAFTAEDATGAVAIGEQSRSFAAQSLAVGNRNEATNAGAMSYGYSAKAVGEGSLAFGFKTYANANIVDNIAAADGHNATNPLRQAVRSKLGNYSEAQLAALETYQNTVRAYYKKVDDRASEAAIATAKTAMDTAKANVDAITLTDVNNMKLVDGGQVSHQGWNVVGGAIGDVVKATDNKATPLTIAKENDVYLTTTDKNGNSQTVQKSQKSGDNAIAIGYYASAKGTSAIAQGSGSVVDSLSGIGIGSLSYVSENSANSIAVGVGAQVRKENSIAIGTQSQVFGAGAIGMGPGSRVMGDNSVGMGYGTDIRSVSSIGLGVRAFVGYGSMNATGLGANVNIGTDAGNSVALGSSARIGDNALNSMAVGYNANVANNTPNSIAFGTRARIAEGATSSLAVGDSASVTKASSTALGRLAIADFENSVALGYRSTTHYWGNPNTREASASANASATNVHGLSIKPYLPQGSSLGDKLDKLDGVTAGYVSVGGWIDKAGAQVRGLRRIVNVAPGALDTDAVTVAQLRDWTDKSAHFLSIAGASNKAATDYPDINDPLGTKSNNKVVKIKSNFDNDTATGTNALALGVYAYANGQKSVAMGPNSYANVDHGVAIGDNAQAWSEGDNGNAGVAIGKDAKAYYWNALALGKSSQVSGWNSLALGANARVGVVKTVDATTGNVTNAGTKVNDGVAIGRDAAVDGSSSIALGADTKITTATKAIAIGPNAKVLAKQVDENTTVQATGAVALGSNASVTGSQYSVALGLNSSVEYDDTKEKTRAAFTNEEINDPGNGVVSVGNNTTVKRRIINVASGVNDNDAVTVKQLKAATPKYYSVNTTETDNRTVNGVANVKSNINNDGATGTGALAVGSYTKASGNYSTALGRDVITSAQLSTGIGTNVTVSGEKSVGIGNNVEVSNHSAVAIGLEAKSDHARGIAVGYKVNVNESDTFAGGSEVNVTGYGSVGIGKKVETRANNAVGIGASTNALGSESIALGYAAYTGYTTTENIANPPAGGPTTRTVYNGATEGIAIGKEAVVESNYAIAIGGNAKVKRDGTKDAESSVAIGAGAKVTGAKYSVALGLNSEVNASDTATKTTAAFSGESNDDPSNGVVSVGKSGKYRRILNVAGGVNDNDAVNVKQLKAAAWGLQVENGTTATDVTPDTTSHKIKLKAGNNVTLDNSSGVVTINATGIQSVSSGNANALSVSTTNGAVTITPNLAGSVTNTGDANKLVTAGVVNTALNNIPVTSFKADAGGNNGTEGVFTPTSSNKQVNITGAGVNGTTRQTWTQGTARFDSDNIGTHVNSNGRILVGLKTKIAVNEVATYDYNTAGERQATQGPTLSFTGLDMKNKKITNVADGEINATSKDAINGSQLHTKLAEKANVSDLANKANVTDLANKVDKTAELHVKAGDYTVGNNGEVSLIQEDASGTQNSSKGFKIKGLATKGDITNINTTLAGKADKSYVDTQIGTVSNLGYKAAGETAKQVAVGTGLTFTPGTGTVGATGANAATTNAATTKTGIAISTAANGVVNIGLDAATRSAIDNAATKSYVDTKFGNAADKNLSNLNTAGEEKVKDLAAAAVKVAPGKNVNVNGVTTDHVTTYTVDAIDTKVIKGDGIEVTGGDEDTDKVRTYTVGLSADTKAKLAKVDNLVNTVGTIGADGRDGKAGTGKDPKAADAAAGDKGLTGQDGLNGKDLTSKVNALRNGEAGTVVYTDENGNRLVKANDGNYYPATAVDKDGNVLNNTPAATTVQARLVNPDGTTTGGTTKLSNIADGEIAAGSTDAINGGQLHTKLAEKADKSDITTINNTLASKANASDLTTLAEKPLTFSGDTGTDATRKLGTTLAVKGAANFTPAATATAGVNIQVASDPTNGLTVSLADTLTNMKGISGNGKDPLVIKNGNQSITITPTTAAETSPEGTVTKPAQVGKVDFGNSKVTSSATPTEANDLVNKGYLEKAIEDVNSVATGNAKLGYKANAETDIKKVAVGTGLHFKSGTGTIGATGADAATTNAATTKTGIAISTEENGVVNIGLDEATRKVLDNAAKLGDTATDGRDGKPGTGDNAGMGKDGLTKEDGLNGKDLTTKVNALRNGEAGTVVYTDDQGNRVVKANDGKWYPAEKVDDKGNKLDGATEVTTPQARLVNPDGTTTGGTTKLSNIADGEIVADSHDAVTGGQLFSKLAEKADKSVVDNLTNKVNTNATDIAGLKTTVDKAITFKGDDNQGVERKLDTTLTVKGAANFDPTGTNPATAAGVNIRVEKDTTTNANGLVVKLADTLTNMKGISGNGTNDLVIKNGDTVVTVKPGANGAKGDVDFGGSKLTNIGTPGANTDAANKSYVDTKFGNAANKDLSNLNDAGKNEVRDLAAGAVKVAPGKNVTVTDATTNHVTTYTVNAIDTKVIAGAGLEATGGDTVDAATNTRNYTVGLSADTQAKLAKVDTLANTVGTIGADGRDGKAGTGKDPKAADAAAGDKGLTGQDGLNGKDLTSKVNALRNGEAGTVVYTDDKGNRLVKANDGNYYKADDVKADGSVKTADENGGKAPEAVAVPQARLVNSTGSTTTATKLSNIAGGEIKEGSTDAINGGQLHEELAKKADVTALAGKVDKASEFHVKADTYAVGEDGVVTVKQEDGTGAEATGKEFKISGLATKTDITTINTALGQKANASDLTTLAEKTLTFSGDTGTDATRKLGTTLAVKGATNFTPAATATPGVNIQVASDPTNGLTVSLADTLTNMKGISGNSKDPLVIKNGDQSITITPTTAAETSPEGTVTKPAQVGKVDFGNSKVTSSATPTEANDLVNKGYLEKAIEDVNSVATGNAKLGYKANAETDIKKVAVGTGLHFKSGTGTIGATGADAATTNAATTKTGIAISTEENGVVNIGLDETTRKVLDNAAKLGDTAVDGRDGKPGTGDNAGMGKDGLTKADGLNGKDLTSKVNALRNGEAGTVVYTDENGNRVVKANDGKWYPAEKVDDKGNKLDGATEVATPQARLVNKDGSTTGGTTVFNNVASAIPAAAADGAKPTFLDNLNTAAGDAKTQNAAVNVSDLNSTAKDIIAKGLIFQGNDQQGIKKQLGETLDIVGEGTLATGATTAANNIRTKKTNDNKLEIGLAKDLVGITSVTNAATSDGAGTKLALDGDKLTITNTQPLPEGAAPGTAPTVTTVTIGKDGINAGNKVISNVATPTAGTDAANKDYVDTQVGNAANKDLSNLNDAGKNEVRDLAAGAVKVASGKNVTVTDATTNHVTTYTVNAIDTKVIAGAGLEATGGDTVDAATNTRNYTVGLSADTQAKLAKVDNLANTVGTIGADGRDGKAGTGKDPKAADAAAGDKGLTGQDGLNGKDLTSKVNALRNGEAGTVIYTDENGNRLAKANDGQYYPATNVDKDGNVLNNAQPATTVQARLVNPDGSTTTAEGATGTKLSNIANGTIADKSKDAVNGGQLHTAKQELATALGGNATVTNGVLTGPTYEITKDDGTNGKDSVNNVGAAIDKLDTRINTVKGLAAQPLTFTGDDAQDVTRALGTTLTVKGAANFDPTGTNPATAAGVNIRVEKDPTTDANGLVVKLADTLTNMKGISGNSKDPLVIKNGDQSITITPTLKAETDSESGNVTKPAQTGKIDFGGSKLTHIAKPEENADVVNKKYVDDAIKNVNNTVAGNATLRYSGDTTTGDVEDGNLKLALATDSLKVEGTEDQIVTTATAGKIKLSLSEKVTERIHRIGEIAGDGRDGKPGNTDPTAIGKDGLTKADGLNGKDLTTKINALRNGEAGTVVYTDAEGKRVVKAKDGNYYKADEVKPDGTVKTAAENGGKEPEAVTAPQARLVNTDGTTTGGTTKLSNIADGAITAGSKDAVNGGQLHTAKQELATALGGNAGVDANGALTQPTYSITKDDAAGGKEPVNNVGSAIDKLDTRINTVKGLAAQPLTFTGDDGQGVERALSTTLTVKGAANFTPSATTPATDKGVNIRVEKDPTTDANGLVVKLADTLTEMKGISGNGTDPLTIKNGDNAVITVKPGANGAKGEVDFGGSKLTNIGEPGANTDAANKAYVDSKVGGVANLGYKANGGEAKTVAVTTGLDFVTGDGTTATATAAKAGLHIETGDNGKVIIGLSDDAKAKLDKVNDIATAVGANGVDGRDGKPGTGDNAGIGKDGLTAADGLNGKDLTSKVNALRNGEAGSVVYTDDQGNRVVKADDGKWYNAKAVDDKGKLKSAEQLPQGVTATEVKTPQARLVNPDGTTTGGTTVFNNVASAIPAAAADGAKPTFLDNLNTAAGNAKTQNAAVNVSDLNSTATEIIAKGLTFQGNDQQGIKKQLGETLDIVGEGTLATGATTAANNIRTKKTNDNKLEIGLVKDLVGITSVTNASDATKPGTKVEFGNDGVTITNTQAVPENAPTGTAPTVTTVTIGKDGINAGSKVISNVAAPNADTDAANKEYVDKAIQAVNQAAAGNAKIGYKANAEAAKQVAVGTGLTFKSGTGTVAPADLAPNTESTTKDTDGVTTKKGIAISTEENGIVNIGLDADTRKAIDNAAKLGNTATDGRDGKAGTGKDPKVADAAAGDKGLTGKDGLNGKDLTSKVNALRNGEAGTVVYTDDKGNRVVKANDGNYYKADDVKADGTVKTADENGGKAPEVVTAPQARLVNPDGTTTTADTATGTKLSNIANGTIADKSRDAVNGGQLHTAKQEMANALGGNAGVDANGALTQPTYSITKDDATGGTDTVNNVGAAVSKLDTRINTVKGLAKQPLTFTGDDGQNVERALGTTLTVKGAKNFTPSATTPKATEAGVNIRVEKDTTTNANGLVVKLADTLTDMKGISGNGTDNLVIKNGSNTITVTPSKAEVKDDQGTVTTPADPGKVNFGDATVTVKNLDAPITYRANSVTDDKAKTVSLKKGLDFAAGDGTTATAEAAKTGLHIETGDDGKVIIGLSNDAKTKLDKVNDIATAVGTNGVDGRDGKPGTGDNAGIGKDGLTGADGLNGKDLTSKVNALRNGEAGSVVYTDAEGNRVVKADDGKWYNAKAVDENGKLKPADQLPQGVTAAEVKTPQARLVNPDGTTTGGTTVFNNVASAIPAAAADGAKPTFLDNLNTAAGNAKTQNAAVNVSDLNSTATEIIAKGLTFQGNDQQGIKKQLGETLDIVGEGTLPIGATTAANNIRTKKNNDGKLEIGLAKDLVGITSVTNATTTDGVGTKVEFGNDGVTIKNTQAVPTDAAPDTKPVVTTVTIGKDGINAGDKVISNVAAPTTDKDAANKAYVDTQIGTAANKDLSNLSDDGKNAVKGLAAAAVKVAAGKNTKVTADDSTPNTTTYVVDANDTKVTSTDTALSVTGGEVAGDNVRTYKLALSKATKDTLAKVENLANTVGTIGADGRDGKAGTGKDPKAADAVAGDKGLTGQDGLNGKDLTSKVNALRNGEAGTVVYTDDQGNRLVKANDGKWYNAKAVDDKGELKPADQLPQGVTATPVDAPQARLVNPDGTTTGGTTKLSNIAAGNIADGSTDAVTGGQLFTKLAEKADKSAITDINTELGKKANAADPITFTGDDAQKVTRTLGTELTVKGAKNFTPSATTSTTDKGVNIRVEKDATAGANGLVVKLADTLTEMKGISGNGTDDLVIKNGTNTITVTPSKAAVKDDQGTVTTPADPGKVNFGDATVTVKNLEAPITYRANSVADTAAKSVSLKKGLDFVVGDGTTATATAAKAGLHIETGDNGKVIIGLSDDAKAKLDKVNDIATAVGANGVDGRDGKPGTGANAGMGKDGLTAADGLNGKDLTSKVNALRNGEAGIVVYTDDKGNRVVKADDGKWYNAKAVDDKGKLKSADQLPTGVTATPVDAPQARLVNPTGTTTGGTTKLSNIAAGNIADGSTDAINGGQLFTKLAEKADKDLGNISTEGENKIKSLATGAVKVAAGKNTKVTADDSTPNTVTYVVDANDTIVTSTDTALTVTGGEVAGDNVRTYKLGLSQATKDTLAKVQNLANTVGTIGADGRDGKAANGKSGVDGNAGDHGLTAKDGMNGKDLTSKVNALRNGEAGTVVYTNEAGDRVVKANDGKFYKADEVDDKGEAKPNASEVTKVEARVVNTDGTTTTATVFNNVASSIEKVKATDDTGAEIAKPTFLERLKTAAATESSKLGVVNVKDLYDVSKDIVDLGLDFYGNDEAEATGKVHRNLGTAVKIQGAGTFKRDKDATHNINVKRNATQDGFTVELAENLTGMKEIAGDGKADLVIKNGDHTKITIKPGTAAEGNKPAVPGTVDFGGSKVTNIGTPEADTDVANKKYVDEAVGANANLRYAADTNEGAEAGKDYLALPIASKTLKIAGTKDQITTTAKDGTITIGLSETVTKQLANVANVGNTESDGRDGKSGVGQDGAAATGVAGAAGPTGKDGLNGKDVVSKVNALRNGEAGTVVYTDDKGNRLVKANDGNYYKATDVKEDGTVKTAAEAGTKDAPQPVTTPEARLVGPNGSTTGAPTKLSNIAAGKIEAGSTDAITGDQLHSTNERVRVVEEGLKGKADVAALDAKADKSKVEEIEKRITKGRVFTADTKDGDKPLAAEVGLGDTLAIQGGADPAKLTDNNIGVVLTPAKDGKPATMTVKLAKDVKMADGTTSYEEYLREYERNEKGELKLDKDNHPIPAKNADGTPKYQLDKNGKPISYSDTTIGGKGTFYGTSHVNGDAHVTVDGNGDPVYARTAMTTGNGTVYTSHVDDKGRLVYNYKRDLQNTVTTVVNPEGVTIIPGEYKGKAPVTLTENGLNNGGNTISNVAPGVYESDAATVGQLNAATNTVTAKVNEAGAHAAALAAMNPLSYDPLKKSQVMAGVGAYKGNKALALGVAHYANEDTMFNVGVSVGGGENMMNAGVTYRFGGEDSMIPERYKGGPISSVYILQDEVSALKAENAQVKADNEQVKADNARMKENYEKVMQDNEEMKAQIKMLMAHMGIK